MSTAEQCIVAACQKLGQALGKDELASLPTGESKLVDITTIQSLLASHALQARFVKIGAEQLVTFKTPVIAQLWGDQFRIVEPGDRPDTIKATAPPREPKTIPIDEFRKFYSGFALLVAKDATVFPKSEPNGPDLRFDSYRGDFGRVDEGDSLPYSFKCRNVGNADLVVSKVDTSCGDCLVPVNGPQTIPAGGEGEIKIIVMTAGQRRGVAKTLYVNSDDPITPVVLLAVTGYVSSAQLIFSPESVNFGKPRRSETVSREVLIPRFEEDKIEVASVSSNTPYVTAKLSGCKYKGLPGCVVTATLKPGAPIGELKGTITILSNHPKQPKAEVPVTANIRGDVDLDRDSLFFGLVKNSAERSKTAITIFTVGKAPLKIEKIDSPLTCISVEVTPKTEGKEYTLTATLKETAPLGLIKGEVVIHTNNPDQPEIKVPVYGYVEDVGDQKAANQP
jgi:hypothetical protein